MTGGPLAANGINGRIIDLTPAGARAFGMDGFAQIDVTLISNALFWSMTGSLIFFHT